MLHKPPRRRVLGILFLASAVCMLVLGETFLTGRLGPAATLVFWTLCLLATCGAIACALLDALRAFGQSRREQRTLLEDTLHEIEAECSRHGRAPGGGAGKSR
jgi:hypothetical protein